MDQRARMLAGLPYRCTESSLREAYFANRRRVFAFNHCPPDDLQEQERLFRAIVGQVGDDFCVQAPFQCDYGSNIRIGDHFLANYNCVILDVAPVTIGSHVLLGPNVAIYTAGHPVHPLSRRSGYEYGKPVTIGDDVWVGGNTVILPGVTIGSGSVIGAGSVVTRDIPPLTVAAGNPCRAQRKITDEDRKCFFRHEVFDVDDY